MASLQLLTSATVANGAPTAAAPTATITTDTAANLTDGGYFTIATPRYSDWRFVLDKDGSYTPPRDFRCIEVDVAGAATADQVRDAIIAAVNTANIGVVASSGGAATVTLTLAFPAVWTGPNYASGLGGAFAITNFAAGSLSGVAIRPGLHSGAQALGILDEAVLEVWSTAGSGVMTVTGRLWGYTEAAGWAPLGIGAGATKGIINGGATLDETSADKIAHKEVVSGLRDLERVYLELSAFGGAATAISARLVANEPQVVI